MSTEHLKALSLKNPLDAFTSYSTHFVILAARTTENARLFTNAENNADTLDAINRTQYLGEKVPFEKANGDVFLVLDTRRFSQFTVENMKYEALINGVSAGQSHSNLVTTVEMTVLDSVGISFVNYMQWLMDSKMQTNFDGIIFMIRVIFVGHNRDGTSETVQSITIPAHLFKMDVNLDYAKGIYNLEFMPNFNFSPSQHSRWLNIGTASSFFSGPSNGTLGGIIRSFEKVLNDQSEKHFNELSPVLIRAGKTPRVAPSGQKFGRLVKYQITIPEEWENLKFTGPSVNSSAERDFIAELKKAEAEKTAEQKKAAEAANKDNPTKDAHMSVDAGMLITDVVDLMLKQVKEIAEFANAEKVVSSDKYIRFHKNVISISSDEDTIIVHVDVVAFDVPNIKPPSQSAQQALSQNEDLFYQIIPGPNGTKKRVPKNFFEVNYIFTGQNLDVLNFDMKIQDLQFMLAANVKVSEGELQAQVLEGQNAKTETGAKPEKKPEVMSARAYDPMLLPMMTEAQSKAFSNIRPFRDAAAEKAAVVSQQEYARNLSSFYAISPIQVAMTIKGNPDIMAKFNIPTTVPHVATQSNTGTGTGAVSLDARKRYREEFEQKILNKTGTSVTKGRTPGTFSVNPQLGSSSYMTTPCFVRVVIKGPNVDFVSNELIPDEDFAKEVFFDNYYVVFKVTNVIERGVFTQQIELWSHNVFGLSKLTPEQISASKQPKSV